MSELAYVLSALLVSILGSAVIWFRSRRPQSLESGVDEFARGLAALKGGRPAAGGRRSG